ncbi:hypothetical protein THOD04_60168 [Vibrio owensii]|uniref:Uncharacterized protein n=1 Tax=Vibrio jasicida TaxID=766224 RepID=A0AAU9QPV2_9VIBR|nr:hypothetical protein THZB04_170010 [Vibrio owensii]CAH1583253.1 hypothetical protein THF1C08_250031 [Vibrio jasicida]CAH1592241.1 hypothetical protein THF1A12_250033 [Vibrio jasicida]CAH1598120.1 hypothetical protein THOD04_60168 [Vibrio owensii]
MTYALSENNLTEFKCYSRTGVDLALIFVYIIHMNLIGLCMNALAFPSQVELRRFYICR